MKFLEQLIEFVFITVIFKAIIVHALADYIMKHSKTWFQKSERRAAIWLHYQSRALELGHAHKSVLHCDEGKCAVF